MSYQKNKIHNRYSGNNKNKSTSSQGQKKVESGNFSKVGKGKKMYQSSKKNEFNVKKEVKENKTKSLSAVDRNANKELSNEELQKLEDCIFFLRGTCTKSDQCEFRHSQEALHNIIPCKFWLDNRKCRNKNCPYRHPTPKVNPKETVCYFFTIGQCRKGDTCPYLHSESKLGENIKIAVKQDTLHSKNNIHKIGEKQKEVSKVEKKSNNNLVKKKQENSNGFNNFRGKADNTLNSIGNRTKNLLQQTIKKNENTNQSKVKKFKLERNRSEDCPISPNKNSNDSTTSNCSTKRKINRQRLTLKRNRGKEEGDCELLPGSKKVKKSVPVVDKVSEHHTSKSLELKKISKPVETKPSIEKKTHILSGMDDMLDEEELEELRSLDALLSL